MKEITVRFADNIAENVEVEAKSMGLTPEELIKFTIGNVYQDKVKSMALFLPKKAELESSLSAFFNDMGSVLKDPKLKWELRKMGLLAEATQGALNCKRCTMKLTVKDIEKGECSHCGTPLKEMFLEEKERKELGDKQDD